ncbi:MAG TPA: PIN domain-containing protein [Planctomycetaceae bacterium]|nr:PIN domain-containing protein [Planctomycetaceae bacterium]
MLLIIVRILYAFVCAGAFATYVSSGNPPQIVEKYPFLAFLVLMLISQAITAGDILIRRKRLDVITAIYFGLLIGVFLSYLLDMALTPLVGNTDMRGVTVMLANLILPYICITVLLQTRNDFRFIIPYVEFAKEVKGGRPFLLDTSSIIDGRIADVIETKILDSELIVPNFILQELQDIADSNDKLRRNRGRRGLDVLSKLRANPNVEVKLYEADLKDLKGLSVDQQLVSVAKQLGGRVVTNDFNLNKVASVHGVDVVNLNDVANSLKPRYLPGEQLQIKIIKPGEGAGQGVGYLDDGTMVVCEQGSTMIGKETSIVVTSVLQNSAGRMIFGRLPLHSDRN